MKQHIYSTIFATAIALAVVPAFSADKTYSQQQYTEKIRAAEKANPQPENLAKALRKLLKDDLLAVNQKNDLKNRIFNAAVKAVEAQTKNNPEAAAKEWKKLLKDDDWDWNDNQKNQLISRFFNDSVRNVDIKTKGNPEAALKEWEKLLKDYDWNDNQKKLLKDRIFGSEVAIQDIKTRGKSADAFEAWSKMLKDDDLTPQQKDTLTQRLFSAAIATKDKAKIAATVDGVKKSESANVKAFAIQQLLRVPQNPFAEDVAKITEQIIKMDEKTPAREWALQNIFRSLTEKSSTFADAVKLANNPAAKFSSNSQLDNHLLLAERAFTVMHDNKTAAASFDKVVAGVKAMKAEEKALEGKKLTPQEAQLKRNLSNNSTNKINQLNRLATNVYLLTDKDFGISSFNKLTAFFDEKAVTTFELGSLGVYALKNSDDAEYSKIKAKVTAMPYGPLRKQIIMQYLVPNARTDEARALLELELKNPAITPREKFDILNGLRGRCGNLAAFQRGFWTPGTYTNWGKYTKQLVALNDAQEKPIVNEQFFFKNAETAYTYGDFDFALDQINRAIAKNSVPYTDTAVMIFLQRKDTAKVSELVANFCKANPQPEKNLHWRVVDFFNKGGKSANFDKAFANDKLTSEQKLNTLRNASELLFRGKRFDICHDIYNDIQNNRFISLKPLTYQAIYVKNPPRTADGFTRTNYFSNWSKMETRFRPYGDCPAVSSDTDAKRFLKDAKQPEINPAWKTGICVLYDEIGAHIFVQCEDPEIIEVIQGKRDGGTLECTFRPNNDAPYNMWFVEGMPGCNDSVNIDFASPSPRYKLTNDTIFRDACLSETGVVAHFNIPWYSFPNDIPFGGKVWYLGLQRWCKGGGFTISGQVHEQARMLNIKFNFSKDQERIIKQNICKTAFNTYRKSFDTGNSAYLWQRDVELGDPEFFKIALEPLVNELDQAGKLLDDPKADFNMIYEKYVPQWANFEYIMAEKRKNYLREKFFK